MAKPENIPEIPLPSGKFPRLPDKWEMRLPNPRVTLTSLFDDKIWRLDHIDANCREKINWGFDMAGENFQESKKYAKLRISAKTLIRREILGGIDTEAHGGKPGTITGIFNALRSLVQWIGEYYPSCDQFDAITQELCDGYLEQLFDSGLSGNTRKDRINILYRLYKHGKLIPDNITFKPWRGLSATEVSKFDPELVRHTPAIPDQFGIPLCRKAFEWIADESCMDRLKETMREVVAHRLKGISNGRINRWLKRQELELWGFPVRTISDLRRIFELTRAACAIPLLLLTGQRRHEFLSLQAGLLQLVCIDDLPGEAGYLWLMEGRTTKISNMPLGHIRRWSVGHSTTQEQAPILAKCCKQLEELAQSVPTQGSLLLKALPFHGTSDRPDNTIDPIKHIKAFASLHDLGQWDYAFHQFRRTFARWFYLRNIHGIHVLSFAMGHSNPQMTLQYVYLDDDLLKYLRKEHQKFLVKHFTEPLKNLPTFKNKPLGINAQVMHIDEFSENFFEEGQDIKVHEVEGGLHVVCIEVDGYENQATGIPETLFAELKSSWPKLRYNDDCRNDSIISGAIQEKKELLSKHPNLNPSIRTNIETSLRELEKLKRKTGHETE